MGPAVVSPTSPSAQHLFLSERAPAFHQVKVAILWALIFSTLYMCASTSPLREKNLPVTEIRLNPAKLSRTETVQTTSFEHLDTTVLEINPNTYDNIHHPLPTPLILIISEF